MRILITLFFISPLITFLSCKDDVADTTYEYHAHVYKPDSAVKHLGDSMPIEIEFESHTGETVHQINVRIYNATTFQEVYNKPADSHVNDPDGQHLFEDSVTLSAANGFAVGDWILEAKVWGETDGEQEEVEQVQFHIDQ